MSATTRARQPLHLLIDPPYSERQYGDSPDSPSSSSISLSETTSETTPTSSDSEAITIFSVLCMHDFQSDDPSHLPFHKNEILDIIRQEDTGWWAAMRSGGDTIGWVPKAFVNPLSDEMARRLRNVREGLRVYEYEAEQLYVSAPIVPLFPPEPEPLNRDPPLSARRPYPPSPGTPMPQPPPLFIAPSGSIKPPHPIPIDAEHRAGRDRSVSAPIPFDSPGQARLTSLPTVSENGARTSSPARVARRDIRSTPNFPPNLPWYLRPQHASQLQLDSEGQVRSGPLLALVEKLVTDNLIKEPTRYANDLAFRNTFLTTFRTFTTADKFFDLLVQCYRMEPPPNLTTQPEFDEWKEKAYTPTQMNTLTIFTIWLEDHRLLEEEPHIAQRMTNFLTLIKSPSQASVANLIIQTIERLTFANPQSSRTPSKGHKKRKQRAHNGDLLKLEPADIAEQLSLIEHTLYSKITPQDCIRHAKSQTNKNATNLTAFCATHDKLAAWVQVTILNNEALGRRADTVDHWIKVAEKCRTLNNFASMSAIVNALSSTVITRLHLTWAHVGRKSMLDALLRYNDPTGGFAGYRAPQQSTDGPCVPFVGMYLTDIVHIQDQFRDENGTITFIRCLRWHDVVNTMLRSQTRPYLIEENDTSTFITKNLQAMTTTSKDQAKLWSRSQEVQQSELAHADIRRGLEAAGF